MKNAARLLNGEEKTSNVSSIPSVLLMRTDSFEIMMSFLTKNFGTTGLSITYSMGVTNGRYEVIQLRDELKKLEAPATKRELMEKTLQRLTHMGWGRFTLNDLDPVSGEISINIEHNPFRDKCGSHKNGGCHYLQGYVAGVASEILEDEIEYREGRCNKTEDSRCTLRLKKTNYQNL